MKTIITTLGLILLVASCEKSEPQLVSKCSIIKERVVSLPHYYIMENGDEVMIVDYRDLISREIGASYCYEIWE